MTTAAMVKENRQVNKDITATLDAVMKSLGEISATQKEILQALKASPQPPASSNQQKVTR